MNCSKCETKKEAQNLNTAGMCLNCSWWWKPDGSKTENHGTDHLKEWDPGHYQLLKSKGLIE